MVRNAPVSLRETNEIEDDARRPEELDVLGSVPDRRLFSGASSLPVPAEDTAGKAPWRLATGELVRGEDVRYSGVCRRRGSSRRLAGA